jgi:DNA topoisomerase-1
MKDERLSTGQRDTAAVTALIAETGFRVGSDEDTGAEKKAYGATTLLSSHVKVDGNELHFDFTGKKGVAQAHTLNSPRLAAYIAGRQAETGADGRLFQTTDAQVRAYVKANAGEEFKVKDFRTWVGTATALRVVASIKAPTTPREFSKARLQVGKAVSRQLGNTPSIALSSYIDPTVFAPWSAHAV